jgi:8-oxo-dGTP pyrophosphatase MutT (NUDIX family)
MVYIIRCVACDSLSGPALRHVLRAFTEMRPGIIILLLLEKKERASMHPYPDYRIAVEAIIVHDRKVLLTKRADDGSWYVPAGKARYEETPKEAIFRETREETNLEAESVEELHVRAFKGTKASGEFFYRVMYTYLVRPRNGDIGGFRLNDEHSDYAWVDAQGIRDLRYDSLQPDVRRIIADVLSSR